MFQKAPQHTTTIIFLKPAMEVSFGVYLLQIKETFFISIKKLDTLIIQFTINQYLHYQNLSPVPQLFGK